MNEKLEMAKNSLYNANEIKEIKENPVVDCVFLAAIRGVAGLGGWVGGVMVSRERRLVSKKNTSQYTQASTKT